MAQLRDLIDATGDEAKEFIKSSLLDLIKEAKSETESVVKETGEKIEKWLVFKLEGEIDSDELEALLNTRRRVIRQFLNSQEIATRARLEKITTGLIDLVLNKALDAII
ncbi:hypothetical protein ACMXYV_10495 [Neptuniibacter sp. SY11_33]|uniref:hypothetical protein n=1 Tax=Neptuniibacter sp. SY11_33 TaxID=3398215 RepID=UPI0039F4680D